MKIRSILASIVLISLFASLFAVFPARAQPEYGPKADELLIHVYLSEDAEFRALEAAEIDITDWPLDPDTLARFKEDPDIALRSYSDLGHYEIDINNQRWPTGVTMPRVKDPATNSHKHYYGSNVWDDEAAEFRHAMAHLLPKGKIETEVLAGTGVKQETDVCYPAAAGWTDYPALEEQDLIHHYDTVEAASIFDAAGFTQGTTSNPYYDPETPGSAQYLRTDPRYGGDLEELIFYIRLDDRLRKDSGLLMTTELRKAGIQVKPFVTERTVCYKQVMVLYDFHLYTGGWSLSPDAPDSLWFLFNSEQYWGGTETGYYGGVGWSANYNGFAHNHTQDQGLAGPIGSPEDYYDYNTDLGKYGTTFTEVYDGCIAAQEAAAKLIPNIPMYARLAVMSFRSAWSGVVNYEGLGPYNVWSYLNMEHAPDTRIDQGFKSNLEGPNPITSEWVWDWNVIGTIYDTLIGRNPYNLADKFGWLAEHWESASWETGKGYVLFTLRQENLAAGTRAPVFHNGDPVRPLDAAFSMIFPKECGPGVAWIYSDLKDIVKIEIAGAVPSWLAGKGIEQNTDLGARDVKVYFDVESYWAVHWAGFSPPILNERVWKDANDAKGWGFNTPGWNPMKIREYEPWLEDSDGDGTVDYKEDGTAAWVFDGYAPAPPGPISAATSLAFLANRDFYLSQDFIAGYLAFAFHLRGDINNDGAVDSVDRAILYKAFGTDSSMLPWGTEFDQYNPEADVNTGYWDMVNGVPHFGDGYIDYKDHGRWGAYFGEVP